MIIYFYFVRRVKNRMIFFFIVTIFLLGLSRLFLAIIELEIVQIIINLLTFLSTLITLYFLPKAIRYFSRMKSPEEYNQVILEKQEVIEVHEDTLNTMRQLNHDLADQLQHVEYLLAVQGSVNRQQIKLGKLKDIVSGFRNEYQNNKIRNVNTNKDNINTTKDTTKKDSKHDIDMNKGLDNA